MKKKIFIIAILVIATFLIGQQVFRYIKYKGNLIVCISNQSKLDSVNIELYLDGKKIMADFFTNDTFHNYKIYPVRSSLGKHTLLVKSKELASKEIALTSLFMKWVVVDFFENDDKTGDNDKYTFLITTQSGPLVIE
jgi:hypothetical protein